MRWLFIWVFKGCASRPNPNRASMNLKFGPYNKWAGLELSDRKPEVQPGEAQTCHSLSLAYVCQVHDRRPKLVIEAWPDLAGPID